MTTRHISRSNNFTAQPAHAPLVTKSNTVAAPKPSPGIGHSIELGRYNRYHIKWTLKQKNFTHFPELEVDMRRKSDRDIDIDRMLRDLDQGMSPTEVESNVGRDGSRYDNGKQTIHGTNCAISTSLDKDMKQGGFVLIRVKAYRRINKDKEEYFVIDCTFVKNEEVVNKETGEVRKPTEFDPSLELGAALERLAATKFYNAYVWENRDGSVTVNMAGFAKDQIATHEVAIHDGRLGVYPR